MKPMRFLVAFVFMLALQLTSIPRAISAPSDDLTAAAKKEGAVEFLFPSSWPPPGVDAIGEAFNKKYGLNLKVGRYASQQMAQDVSKVMTRAAVGAAPEWDVMVVTDAHHATLSLKKLLQAVDYRSLGVDSKMVHYRNGTVSIANQLVQPAH